MAETPNYGLTSVFYDSTTKYTGAEISFLHRLVDRQLNGSLLSVGSGVVRLPDADSFLVLAGPAADQFQIKAGSAIIRVPLENWFSAIWAETAGVATITADPAEWEPGDVGYLYAVPETRTPVGAFSANDTRCTGIPKFQVLSDDSYEGGLKLAKINADGSIDDERTFVGIDEILDRLEQAEADITDLQDRVTALEEAVEGGGGGGGGGDVTQAEFDALAALVQQLQTQLTALQAQVDSANGDDQSAGTDVETLFVEQMKQAAAMVDVNERFSDDTAFSIDAVGLTGNGERRIDDTNAPDIVLGGNAAEGNREVS